MTAPATPPPGTPVRLLGPQQPGPQTKWSHLQNQKAQKGLGGAPGRHCFGLSEAVLAGENGHWAGLLTSSQRLWDGNEEQRGRTRRKPQTERSRSPGALPPLAPVAGTASKCEQMAHGRLSLGRHLLCWSILSSSRNSRRLWPSNAFNPATHSFGGPAATVRPACARRFLGAQSRVLAVASRGR